MNTRYKIHDDSKWVSHGLVVLDKK